MQNGQLLPQQRLTAIGVVAPCTAAQTMPTGSPRHKRGAGIEESLRPQPCPLGRLLNFTAVYGQHPANATSASVAKKPC